MTLEPDEPTKIELPAIAIAPGFEPVVRAVPITAPVVALICDMNASL